MCKDKPVEGLDSLSKKERYIPTEYELERICQLPKMLANELVGKYGFHNKEDVESLANYEVAKALSIYDPNRGTSVIGFVYWLAKSRVITVAKQARTRRWDKLKSLDVKLSKNDRHSETLADFVPSKAMSHTLEVEESDLVTKLLKRTSGTNKKIVILHCQGYTFQEISDKVGICLDSVRRRYYRTITDLTEYANSNNLVRRKNLIDWAREYPEESSVIWREAAKRGGEKYKKNMNRLKSKIGWSHLTLGQCRVLELLSDEKIRTISEVSIEVGYTYKKTGRMLNKLMLMSYVEKLVGGGPVKRLYQITKKAIQERKCNAK